MSAAYCYLRPARSRPNLSVRTGVLVHRVRLDGKRAAGVECYLEGRLQTLRARREVVLSAGAINSPQLLELSGIGRPEVLGEHGIAVAHELPGVGENLSDHMAPRVIWRLKPRGATYNERARGLGLVWQVIRYATTGGGFLSLPSAPVLAFLRSREGLAAPDVQLHFAPYAIRGPTDRSLLPEPGMTCTTYILRPDSRGSIHIRSRDPSDAPAIRLNFLSDPLDRRVLVDSVRWVRKIVGASAMDDFRDFEMKPGSEVETDDEIVEWIRATAETAFHPVGTCKMGQDPMAVVDERLRVRGMENLRIADGSIMPTLVSGNTNAACIMIGEKASEMMLADAA
jgi:choline dehydrogenase